MRSRWTLLAIPLLLGGFLAGCGDDDDEGASTDDTTEDGGGGGGGEDTGSVNILFAGEPDEASSLQEVIDEMINADAEYEAEFEASGNFEEQLQIRAEGGTLDLAAVPQPGAVQELAASGNLTSLEDLGFDMAELEEVFGEAFLALGEYEGEHYGLPTNINLKSMVWYPKDDFDAAGYEIPETWDDMLALSDQIVADGGTPWCVGFSSEGSTGWPATDWMEDIVLRTAGADVYDQWVAHEIPFDDPAIVTAAETFGEVLFKDGYVLGGAASTVDIPFGDAPLPMFDEEPGCWLHRQASFIDTFFPEDAEAGVDYDWFPLPPIDQEGILFAGELTVVGSNGNRPEVKDFLEKFISDDVQCSTGEAAARLSPNVNVGADCYGNDNLGRAAEVLAEANQAGTGRFDASDLMPAEVGSGSFWTGMVDYVQGGSADRAAEVLAEIEASWPS
ncbi:MAG TPA: ABC transporter substrate-binding protein [Acidimicrobiales bacterium]|nr:ABC transporter substrate-binding protein [Acidimicrobiales bacterium]